MKGKEKDELKFICTIQSSSNYSKLRKKTYSIKGSQT